VLSVPHCVVLYLPIRQVAITPEVTSRGVNRAVMENLVKHYRETALGKRLPAYDGRKSLYTAGPLPFQSKEFQINLLDEDDGSNTPRLAFAICFKDLPYLTP
jgi:hypothetical protein